MVSRKWTRRRWLALLAAPLILSSCQELIDTLVPGAPATDGTAALLQIRQSQDSGDGTAASPALVHVEARAGNRLAVRVLRGKLHTFEDDTAGATACLHLPEADMQGVRTLQFLVEVDSISADVLVGLFDGSDVVEVEPPGTGSAGSAGSELQHLIAACSLGAPLDYAHLAVVRPTLPATDSEGGGNAGAGGADDEEEQP